MPEQVTVTLDRGVAERTLGRYPGDDLDYMTDDQRALAAAFRTALEQEGDGETVTLSPMPERDELIDDLRAMARDAERGIVACAEWAEPLLAAADLLESMEEETEWRVVGEAEGEPWVGPDCETVESLESLARRFREYGDSNVRIQSRTVYATPWGDVER